MRNQANKLSDSDSSTAAPTRTLLGTRPHSTPPTYTQSSHASDLSPKCIPQPLPPCPELPFKVTVKNPHPLPSHPATLDRTQDRVGCGSPFPRRRLRSRSGPGPGARRHVAAPRAARREAAAEPGEGEPGSWAPFSVFFQPSCRGRAEAALSTAPGWQRPRPWKAGAPASES